MPKGLALRTTLSAYPNQMDFITCPEPESAFIAGIGSGKALTLDTPIPTLKGWKTMGELQLGETLFDEQGQPCQVTFMTDPMFGHKVYEVAFSDGSTIKADEDHLWFTWTWAARKSYKRAAKPTLNPSIKTTKSERVLEME